MTIKSKFKKFDEKTYEDIYAKVKSGEVKIDNDVTKEVTGIETKHVKVVVVE